MGLRSEDEYGFEPADYESAKPRVERHPDAVAFDDMVAMEHRRLVSAVPDESIRFALAVKHVLARPRRGSGYVCRCGWRTERTDFHALTTDHLIEVARSTK